MSRGSCSVSVSTITITETEYSSDGNTWISFGPYVTVFTYSISDSVLTLSIDGDVYGRYQKQ